MLQKYLLDLIILLKEKKIEREVDIAGLLEFTVQGGCLMERDASIEAFGFTRDVIGSTIRPTIVNKLAMIVLQRIMNPSFVSLDIFALVIPYLFSV